MTRVADRVVTTLTERLDRKRTSRRSFLVKTAVVGSALAVNPWRYLLRPGTAYASLCGPAADCASGWTVFCCTINNKRNTCPPGTLAAGWWKADNSGFCGGKARYYVDCNAKCTKCGCGASGICGSRASADARAAPATNGAYVATSSATASATKRSRASGRLYAGSCRAFRRGTSTRRARRRVRLRTRPRCTTLRACTARLRISSRSARRRARASPPSCCGHQW